MDLSVPFVELVDRPSLEGSRETSDSSLRLSSGFFFLFVPEQWLWIFAANSFISCGEMDSEVLWLAVGKLVVRKLAPPGPFSFLSFSLCFGKLDREMIVDC